MTLKPMLVAALVLSARLAAAQTVVAPTAAIFDHPDAEFAITSGYRVEFFRCNSVSPGPPAVCVGRAAAPFTTGAIVPKASITGTAAARRINLLAAPVSGVLASMPTGVGFVGTLVALGDLSAGGFGESGRTADSNPFYASGRTPASPTGVVIQ